MTNTLKINNTTTVQYVKQGTFRYVQQVCEDGMGIRYGGTIASYIEAEAYYMTGGVTEVNEGDVIYYYQDDEVAQDFSPASSSPYLIGIFTVDKCIRGNNTYTFVAYDNIKKLDADYSARLLALKSQFPMRVKDFLDDIASFMSNLGVTIYLSSLWAYIYDDDMTPSYINYFYTNGITVRDIVSYFAEAEFVYWYAMPDGKIYFYHFALDSQSSRDNHWYKSDRYIIAPTDQVTYTGSAVINGVTDPNATLIPVFYKENGLEHEGYSFAPIDGFHFYRTDGYEVYGDYSIQNQTNPYNIYNNLFADYAKPDDFYFSSVCNTGHTALTALLSDYNITPFEVHLFPFRNPFSAGQIIPHIVDKDGNRISSVVTRMELTDSEVVLTCSGSEYYNYSSYGNYNTESNVQAITALINDMTGKLDSALSSFVSVISGKKVSIIGDSISTFDAVGYKYDSYAMYYPTAVIPDVETVEDTWWKKVLDASGCEIEVNASYSGSRATNTDAGKPDFYVRCDPTILGNPDTIIVALGTNDSNNSVAIGDFDFTTTYTSLSEATFATAYTKGIKALQNNFPNAQIVCVALNMGGTYRNAIVRIATYLGCKYVTCHDYEKGSGSHPNAHGMRQIASAVLALQTTDSTFTTEVVPTQYIENGTIYLNDDSYTFGVAPSANITSQGLNWKDSQNETVAFIRHYIRTSGEYRILAQVNGKSGNNTVSHYTYMAVDGSGNPYVSCSHPSAWKRALGLNYAVNDTFTPANTFSAYGYVTSSTKNIHFNFPVEKSMEDITTVTVTTLTGAIRGASGYVDGGSLDWTSGYTVTADKVSNNVVHVQISKSTAFSNVTNNTPLVGNFTIGLKFT